tara:strand:- start:2467 stop:3450 length:984 start_codon:yes stop_codon:yes gene_type:complete
MIEKLYVDPFLKSPCKLLKKDNVLVNEHNKKYKIINNIPRFVTSENYASSFGLQWNKFRKTQLDSFTGTSLTENRLLEFFDHDLSLFKNKEVLEVGSGAGRFTEILLKTQLSLLCSVDFSTAVEANYQNHGNYKNLFICQADVRCLPYKDNSFDVVVCLGVIQHTPNPEETIKILVEKLNKGGTLLIDHYALDYPENNARKFLRKFLISKNPSFCYLFVSFLTAFLWPIHRLVWLLEQKLVKSNRGQRIRKFWLKVSPILDYHTLYRPLSPKLQYMWSKLDTHDTLTDFYKHLRSKDQIKRALEKHDLEILFVKKGGNGIIAKAIKR